MKWALISDDMNKDNFLALRPNSYVLKKDDDLMNLADCDAIYIDCHPTLHYKYALMAMDIGKAVCVASPLALNEWEVQALVLKAKEKNIFLMENIASRFSPSYQIIKKMMKNKQMGPLQEINFSFCLSQENKQDDVLVQYGSYACHLLVDLFGINMPIQEIKFKYSDNIATSVIAHYQKERTRFNLELSIDENKPLKSYLICAKGHIEIPSFHNNLELSLLAFEETYKKGLLEHPHMKLEDSLFIAHEIDRLHDALTADPDDSVYRM